MDSDESDRTPENEEGLSAAVLRVAEPLLKECKTWKQARAVISLTMAGWNRSLLPEDDKPGVRKEVIDRFVPKATDTDAIGAAAQIMDIVAERRQRLFPKFHRIISNYDVEVRGDSLALSVTSAPLPDDG
jgi:hypothetical protein